MANRHLSRSIVLQSLFERDFRDAPDNTIEEILHRHVDEFAPGMGDFSFVKNLADGVLKKRKDIDTIIEKAAPEWCFELAFLNSFLETEKKYLQKWL
jgi:transcription termination factor NusB